MPKVLLIEESKDFCAAAQKTFESKGWKAVTYNACAEGIAKITEVAPDLIILGAVFNKKADGLFAARALRRNAAHFRHSKIPLMLLADMKAITGSGAVKPSKYPYFVPVDDIMPKTPTADPLVSKAELLLKAAVNK